MLWCVYVASSGTTTTSGPGGPSQNGLVVSIVIGAFVMFVATVIGSVVSTQLFTYLFPGALAVLLCSESNKAKYFFNKTTRERQQLHRVREHEI